MTTNQTIDGVSLHWAEIEAAIWGAFADGAKDYRGCTRERLRELRALLDAPTKPSGDPAGSFDKHMQYMHENINLKKRIAELEAAQPQGEPTGEMEEAGCQAYMDADGMIGILHRSSMGHAYRAMRALEQPAPVAVALPSREQLRDIIAQAIGGDTYDCVRVWKAWGVGTMSQDDFIPVVDQEERLYEIADACLDEVARLNGAKP